MQKLQVVYLSKISLHCIFLMFMTRIKKTSWCYLKWREKPCCLFQWDLRPTARRTELWCRTLLLLDHGHHLVTIRKQNSPVVSVLLSACSLEVLDSPPVLAASASTPSPPPVPPPPSSELASSIAWRISNEKYVSIFNTITHYKCHSQQNGHHLLTERLSGVEVGGKCLSPPAPATSFIRSIMFIIIAPGRISLNTMKMNVREEICQKDIKISG